MPREEKETGERNENSGNPHSELIMLRGVGSGLHHNSAITIIDYLVERCTDRIPGHVNHITTTEEYRFVRVIYSSNLDSDGSCIPVVCSVRRINVSR